MSIFSSNYNWDRKDDDPLSNLISDDAFSSRNRNSNKQSITTETNRSRLGGTDYLDSSRKTRDSSTFLENFLNEEQLNLNEKSETRKTVKFDESTIQQAPSSSRSTNIDWLGLSSIEDESSAKSANENDDWLTSGLSRRQNKFNQSTFNQVISSSKNDESSIERDNEKTKIEKVNSVEKSERVDDESTVLHTKISILEIEKQHLTDSIDKLNLNHEQEINQLKQLHEQQLSLTKSILVEQENLIKDERDRRITDLQNQLNTMERYLDENRSKTNDRVNELEKEWFNELKRLKTIHETTVNRLIEQHEQDLDRMKKIKEREIETLQSLQNKFGNLDDMLVKWQQNSDKMETIHHKLIIEQDRVLNERLNDIGEKDKQIENIEQKWSQLASNLKYERESSDQLKNLFIKTVEDEKQSIDRERIQLREDRNEFESERKRFSVERRSIEVELDKSRELINQSQLELRKHEENFQTKENEFNRKQLDLTKQEAEWRINYERERDRLANQSKLLDKDQLKLTKELSELKRAQDALCSERKLFEQKKELFDKEKIKLESLAVSIVKRSEELEELSETVSQDRKENERLFDESEKLKKEFDEKLKILETNLVDLKRRETHLERQSEIVHQEWQELQSDKMNILCSLCAGSLNQGKQRTQKINEFIGAVQSSNLYLNINDNDRSLLIWQITGQEENAMLEEETEFLKTLKR